MRLHILPMPHAPVNQEFIVYAFTQVVTNACKMFKQQNMHVIYYGSELCDVECDEHVNILSKEDFEKEFKKLYGDQHWKEHGIENVSQEFIDLYNTRCIQEIEKRKLPNDLLVTFSGNTHLPIYQHHSDMIDVEGCLVYGSSFARYKVYSSYCTRHGLEGIERLRNTSVNFHDTVIPIPLDVDSFEFKSKKQDYFLMCGRIVWAKGLDIAINVAIRTGIKLVLAGVHHDEHYNFPPNVEYVGPVDPEQRNELLRNAKATFCLAHYNDSFNLVALESMLSGTPVISVDHGAYTEIVLQGVTGYRCRSFDEFCLATKEVEKISPYACREWAEKNYNMKKIGLMYKHYFDSIIKMQGELGWFAESSEKTNLDYLIKQYP